jgi:hypothetical protein
MTIVDHRAKGWCRPSRCGRPRVVPRRDRSQEQLGPDRAHAFMQQTVAYPQHTRKKCAAASILALLAGSAAYGALCANRGKFAEWDFAIAWVGHCWCSRSLSRWGSRSRSWAPPSGRARGTTVRRRMSFRRPSAPASAADQTVTRFLTPLVAVANALPPAVAKGDGAIRSSQARRSAPERPARLVLGLGTRDPAIVREPQTAIEAGNCMIVPWVGRDSRSVGA